MVNEALRRLVSDLEAHRIEYSVIGAVALNQHGYQRFTTDIDLLMSPEGLERFRNELVGRGYRPAFNGATKKFRETIQNVPIEIITSGEYPGDGRPKSVRFHDPSVRFVVIDGIKTVDLARLVELKLASGMTGGVHRLKDFVDVMALIKVMNLSASLVDELNPYVREKYSELWTGVHDFPDPMAEGHTFDEA